MKPGFAFAAALVAGLLGAAPAAALTYASTIVASGLNNPRGLAFGPDGGLYIAEAGVVQTGGPSATARGNTYYLSATGSITRLLNGTQERVVTGIASIGTPTANETTGPADIAFANGAAYLLTGFGLDPAIRGTGLAPGGNNLGRIFTFAGGTLTPFADPASIEAGNPDGREVNSNPYHMAALADGLLVSDAGGNTLLKVAANGATTLVATFPPRFIGNPAPVSDAVLTGVALGPDGNYYVAELTGFPFTQGAARIYRVTPQGAADIAFTGYTNIADIAFGADGQLYVLELDSNGLATPGGGGALYHANADGSRTLLFSTGLIVPTGLAIGADGAFYVTNFSAAEGRGQVLRIAAVPEPGSWALMILGFGAAGVAARRARDRRYAESGAVSV